MIRIAAGIAMSLYLGWPGLAFEDPKDLLRRFQETMNTELARLPDYVCAQTVERFTRGQAERPWQPVDTIRLEVAMVGNQEFYGRPGKREFGDRPLAELVGKGTITTGQLGLFAKHVFLSPGTQFAYRGEAEHQGRPAHEFTYDVPPSKSKYRLRTASAEETVGFQGSFLLDAQSLDLLLLDIQAYDIAEALGLAEADTTLVYGRIPVQGVDILLPVSATQSIVATDGVEALNRSSLGQCRQYKTESTVRFAGERAAPSPVGPPAPAETLAVTAGNILELAFDTEWNPAAARLDDSIRLRLTRLDGKAVEGTALARVVRLERQDLPFTIWEVGLELDSLQVGNESREVNATMEEAGPANGLIRQQKRMDPVFTRKRTARMNVLVREVQQGQGILLWEARRGALPRGLKMRWRVLAAPDRTARR